MTEKGVKYDFGGQYYTGQKHGEEIKNYEISIVFPEETPKALSLFKTGLLQPHNAIYKLMIAKYTDFRKARTLVITNVTNLDKKVADDNVSNVATMNVKQLTAYVKKNKIALDVKIYEGDITRLREAIIKAEKDPEAFKEIYKADLESYNFNLSLNTLNDVPEEGEADKTSNEDVDTTILTADDLLGDLDGSDEGDGGDE